jgi:hypothetical protein
MKSTVTRHKEAAEQRKRTLSSGQVSFRTQIFGSKTVVCRVEHDCEPNANDRRRLVSKLSANKVIGAKPMDHCAA